MEPKLWSTTAYARPSQANMQVKGNPNPDQQARINAGQYVEQMWYGPTQQDPYRSNGDPADMASVMSRLQTYLPGMAAYRMPFNINSWGTYGTKYQTGELLASTREFFRAAKAAGIKLHYVMMDGPSQRDGEELPHPKGRDHAQWMTWAAALNARQITAHQMLVAKMVASPEIYPDPWAFEFVNEPDSYAVMGRAIGNSEAYAIYAQHNVAIYEQVYKNGPFPNAWMFVGGFNYSANFGPLALPNTFLPDGRSPIQYIRQHIPAARLCWSMHAYSGWVGSDTQRGLRVLLRRRMGGISPVGIEGDRICITETNVRHDVVFRYPFVQDALPMYNMMRNAQWLAEMNISLGWWTGANYAQARLLQIIAGLGGVRMDEAWSFFVFHMMAAFRNNPLYFTSAQNGMKELDLDLSIQRLQMPDGGDELAEAKAHGFIGSKGEAIGINRVGVGYGGMGTCVVRGNLGTFNNLLGGDGWNVLYGPEPFEGQKSIDCMALGRGGGVIRSPAGERVIMVNSSHTPSRLFLGPGKTTVALLEGEANHTIISVDTSSTYNSVVYSFNHNRNRGNGDRLYFGGAFASFVDLRDAITPEFPDHTGDFTGKLQYDLVIKFPSGGSLRLVDSYNLLADLRTAVLDFDGWVPPEDYDPAALAVPAPPIGSIEFESLLYPEEAGGDPAPGDNAGGGDTFMFDNLLNPVQVLDNNNQPVLIFAAPTA